jgi:hypothetical protein
MADEKITIKIDVDANTTAIEKATQATKRLKREAGRSSGKKEIDDYGRDAARSLKKTTANFKRHFDSIDRATQMFGKGLRKFLGMAIKGVVAEMVILSATMLGVHALFAAGNWLAKGYHGAMKMAAQGVAALTVTLATGAAAMREQQAAMYAFRGKGAKEFGAGINQVRVAMRGLQMDQDLAGLGTEALNKAYAVMSKTMSTPQINASNKLFKSLMDFGSAAQDPAKAAEKVGAVIEAITGAGTGKDKKSLAATISLIKELGPEAEKALTKANVKTKEQLKKLISSGELAKLGGVEGQFDTTNNTLMGSIKKFMALIKGEFADFGLMFLEPAKEAFQKIFQIIQRDIRRLIGITSDWGSGTFMDGLVNAVDKVSTFFVDLTQKWLPRSEGQFKGIAKWWNNMLRTFGLFRESLRKYIEPAQAIERAFKPIWTAIKDNGIRNLDAFREGILENQNEINEFGERIAQVIDAVGDLAIGLKKAFFDILPVINDVLKGVTDIFKMLTSLLTKSSGTGMLGSLAPILGMFVMSGKMKNTKGGVLGTQAMGTMNVTASTVNVNGQSMSSGRMGGTPQAGGAPGSSRVGTPPGALVGRNPVTGRFEKLSSGTTPTAFYPTPTGAPIPPGGSASSSKFSSPGMLSPKIDEFGVESKFKRYTKADVDYMNKTGRDPHTGAGTPYGKKVSEFKRLRMNARFDRTESRFGQGMTKFNNSGMARMGVGMGLAAASQYAPEEMRGAMALGGMVGAVNPMAGLAVAGIGGAMKAKSGGAGALAGMAGGAAAGAMIGGPYGAAIGAALGVVAGGIMGGVNEIKARAKEAEGAINGAMSNMLRGIMQSSYSQFERGQAALDAGKDTSGFAGSAIGAGGKMAANMRALQVRAQAALREERLGGSLLDRGMTRETGTNVNAFSMKAAGNTFIDMANSSLSNPLQTVSSTLGAMVPDILNVGALIGKIPGAEQIGSLFNSGVGKGIKSVLGFNVKSSRREAEEKFLTQLQKEGVLTKEQFDDAMKDPGAGVNKFVKDTDEKTKAFEQIDEVNNKRLEKLKLLTGKTAPELEKLAKNMGVDLYDATMTFDDMVTKLKINMIKSAAEMKAANQNAFMDTSIYDAEIKRKETLFAVNDKTRILNDRLKAGTAGETDILEFLRGNAADMTALHGGDAISAFYDQQRIIGKGGLAYTAGGSLEGQESQIAGNPLFQQQQQKVLGGFAKTGAEQITAMLGDSNLMAAGGSTALTQQILAMDPAKQQKLLTDLQSGTLTGMGANTPPGQKMTAEQSLRTYGLGLTTEKLNDGSLDSVADSMDTASEVFKEAVTEFTKYTSDFFTAHPIDKTPEWYTKESFEALIKGDTSSPRGKGIGDTTSSRLSQTMARHSAIDSQLTGSRNVTSAYRTTGLGSINSDHVTGRALDLTGQNLGQYAKLVHANGGFAEFHGTNASRHLHVVPGPGGPTGDTQSPARMTQTKGQMSNGAPTYNISFAINGTGNMSPNEIAQTVIRKIKETQTNEIQRS